MVFMPPRHGKSEIVSKKFPAWYIGRHPDREVIISSYSADLAFDFSRIARNTLREHGPDVFGVQVARDTSAVGRWGIEGHRGGLTAAGVGGPITGRGAHVAIIDDPVKNAEEAASEVIRERVWDWYRSTLYTRLAPGGAIVLVMTRWHEDDLAGRLLREMENGGEQWEVISLPALAEENDPLGRAPGEPLWPERFPKSELLNIQRTLGSYLWAALYQQRPQPVEGGLFKRTYFRYFRREGEYYLVGDKRIYEKDCWRFSVVDPAISTKDTADYFVMQTWAITPYADMLLLDVVRERIDGPEQLELIRQQYDRWCPAYIGVEKVAFQSMLIQMLLMKGLPVRELKPDKDKFTRALPLAAKYEAGKVYHLAGAGWVDEYEAELLAFPNGAHDDQVDAAAYAALEIAVPKTPVVTKNPLPFALRTDTQRGGYFEW